MLRTLIDRQRGRLIRMLPIWIIIAIVENKNKTSNRNQKNIIKKKEKKQK